MKHTSYLLVQTEYREYLIDSETGEILAANSQLTAKDILNCLNVEYREIELN